MFVFHKAHFTSRLIQNLNLVIQHSDSLHEHISVFIHFFLSRAVFFHQFQSYSAWTYKKINIPVKKIINGLRKNKEAPWGKLLFLILSRMNKNWHDLSTFTHRWSFQGADWNCVADKQSPGRSFLMRLINVANDVSGYKGDASAMLSLCVYACVHAND